MKDLPDGTRTLTESTILFGSVEGRVLEVVAFVDALEGLGRGTLVECDLGASTRGDHFVCVARFRGTLPDAAARRLEFWAWRSGGTPSPGSRQGKAAFRACDLVRHQATPDLVPGAVRELLARHLGPTPDLSRERLTLRIGLGTPEAAGLTYDLGAQALFVPTPRLPPFGERMAVEIRLRDGAAVEGEGIVTRLRGGGQDGPGTPAGFVLTLVAATSPLRRALELAASERPALDARRSPRYPVRARAAITAHAEGAPGREPPRAFLILGHGACVENLSQGGAFVSTPEPVPLGTRVRLALEVPGRAAAAGVDGTVVYGDQRGVGIRFEADRDGDVAIGTALELLTARRRRALVVDDDAGTRRALGDALAGHGFEVFTAADGAEGLHALIDLLLDLDLLVVDLHTPGLDGERLVRLVREPGGERDLAILVTGGDVDGSVHQRLTEAGADAVLPRAAGVRTIADAALSTLHRRRWPGGLGAAGQRLSA